MHLTLSSVHRQDDVIDIDSSDDDEPVARRAYKPRKKAARRGSRAKAPIVLDASNDEVGRMLHSVTVWFRAAGRW